MAQPTRAQIEEALTRLPPEQHAMFLAEAEKRMKRPAAPQDPKLAAALAATRGTMNDPAALGEGYLGATGPSTAANIASVVSLPVGGTLAGVATRGVLGGAARFAAARPTATAAAVSAVPDLLRGDIKGAAGTAALTAAGMKGASGLGGKAKVLFEKAFSEWAKKRAEATAAAQALGRTRAAAEIRKLGMTPIWELEAQAAPAAKTVAETAKVLPKGQRAMATNLGGKAKPGPAPTAPEDLEAALRASVEQSPLRPPRIDVGAQKVGKSVGMTKEEVRKQTGPVLNEALGEASPILPKQALKSIIDKMKSMPMSEREAYVAKATSGKTQWQVENIRRTLEHLGLLLPVGMAAGAAAREKRD